MSAMKPSGHQRSRETLLETSKNFWELERLQPRGHFPVSWRFQRDRGRRATREQDRYGWP